MLSDMEHDVYNALSVLCLQEINNLNLIIGNVRQLHAEGSIQVPRAIQEQNSHE